MRVVDLFSGCGGLSLGFEKAGFNVVAAYDKWAPAVSIYKSNFNHPIYEMDLNSDDALAHIRKQKPDIIIGGPPCQDFSIAGSRNCGERANLTIRYAEIVKAVKPKMFVMENVYNIERMPILPQAIAILREAGYGITRRVLDASHCGAPQARRRFIMVGCLGEKDGFLCEKLQAALSVKQMTVHDYLGDKLGTEFYYMHPRNYSRRAIFSIYEPSATIRGVNRPIPDGYKRHNGDRADISPAVRVLTSQERGYLQTFPESFVWVGKKTDVEQAIGNAVPVELAHFIAKRILEYVKDNKRG